MRKFLTVLLLFIVFVLHDAQAQKSFPSDYFRPPLDIPLYLSGTFGELRSNHFHAGIDIKTQGVEGLKVFAAANGYVSRIKVGLGGYGNALYITHPNGYVTVYGHLKSFNKAITAFLRKQQYKRKSFVIDLYPGKDLLRVKKGDVIALSGNTGGSLGPHLHFEIRDAANQHPLNPLLFKSLKISDDKSPVVAQLVIYPVGDSSCINGLHDTSFFKVMAYKGRYGLKADSAIKVHGKVAFGLRAYDRMDKTHNKNGVFSEQLSIDSVAVFEIKMDELSFYTSRYINSLIDYRYFMENKRRVVRTQLDTNNRLAIYRIVKNNGIFAFDDTLTHHLEYVVSDAYGNKSRFAFRVKGYKPDSIVSPDKPVVDDNMIFVQFSKKAELLTDSLKAEFPANAFYRSQLIRYGLKASNEIGLYSPVYTVGSKYIPLQKYFNLSVAIGKPVADTLKSKLYIAKQNADGKWDFAGGSYENGWLTTRMRSLGKFAVLMDTVPPVIKPVNVANSKKVANQHTLKFKIYDKPTGIKKYAGFLNDKWILMAYNPKKNLLTYRFDWLLKKGKNRFKLYVFDNRDNEAVYEVVIYK